jgi:transcription initiation factor TFIID TATA-box-binding protein
MTEINIQNIVASTKFAEKLDLDVIAQSIKETEYEPEQFPGLIYRIKEPKTATLLFTSGAANCTGAKSLDDVKANIKIIADKLEKIGIEVFKEHKIVIQNIVATSDLKGELNLSEVAVALGLERVEYEPEQFPGLVYRLEDPSVALLLFGSGKIVCAGAKKIDEVNTAIKIVTKELTDLNLLRR